MLPGVGFEEASRRFPGRAAPKAVEVIQAYRSHPRWRLIGFPAESRPLHDALWEKARARTFAFRRLYDTRTALTLTAQGVTEFATANVKDFESLGFTVAVSGQRTYNVQQFTEQVYVRIRGRQMAFKVSSDTLGTAWQLGVPRIEVRPDGRR